LIQQGFYEKVAARFDIISITKNNGKPEIL